MYCLPVNLDFVIHALADETPNLVYYLDLETGGVFSVVQPGDVCSISEELDHSVACNLSRFPERFATLAWPWHEDKSALIREFISTLPRSYFEYQSIICAAASEVCRDSAYSCLRPPLGCFTIIYSTFHKRPSVLVTDF